MTITYTYSVARASQVETPTSGGTVQMDNGGNDLVLILNSSGTLATLTINFPTDFSYLPGQTVTIFSDHEITAVTWGNSTNVVNQPNTILANSYVQFLKTAFSNTWCGNT